MMLDTRAIYVDSISNLETWLVNYGVEAYEPFDGLNSYAVQMLTSRSTLSRIFFQQLVRRCPVNLRPVLGVQKSRSAPAAGFFAAANLKLYSLFGNESFLRRGKDYLQWLVDNTSDGHSGMCWGDPFNYQSRVFYLPKGTPTVVWTAHIGHAFLDAYEVTNNTHYLDVAISACKFIIEELVIEGNDGEVCISYVPGQKVRIHNANMLGVSLLARTNAKQAVAEFHQIANQSVKYTMKHQLDSGAWYYGEADNLHWVDNFHTGYVLTSLSQYIAHAGETGYISNLKKGADYYMSRFFLTDGTPKYYDTKVFPIDIQCASQSIETLAILGRADPKILLLAEKVACWTISNMQSRNGYFYYRRYRLFTNKTVMMHWGQATMHHAMAVLLGALPADSNGPIDSPTSIAHMS